ncbi:hypothetical protein, partial [Sphingobacterium sp.]|uniref:hypothetical protein n=1 Tax=Sphingobacterium sp. TaxID=341027 RepID=UPI002FDB938B
NYLFLITENLYRFFRTSQKIYITSKAYDKFDNNKALLVYLDKNYSKYFLALHVGVIRRLGNRILC